MSAPVTLIHKVVAYITRADELLVFTHTDFPAAGLQVPAGTLESGEKPEQAVLREAQEETGLVGLKIKSYLGLQDLKFSSLGSSEIHRRYYFHLEHLAEPPAAWHHYEHHPSAGSLAPIAFDFFWVKFTPSPPELSGDQGFYLQKLARMHHRRRP